MANTARSAGMLQQRLGQVATAAAGFFGIRQAATALVGFNDSMEQSRITVAGMLSQASGRAFNDTTKDSIALVDQLQQRAKVSVGTTQDMVGMSAMLVRPLTAAGASMKD